MDLEQLFLATLEGGDRLKEASDELSKMYDNPPFVEELINFVMNTKNNRIRTSAYVGLATMITRTWAEIDNEGLGGFVMENTIKMLGSEQSSYIHDQIVHYISHILRSDVEWPGLFAYATECLGGNTLTAKTGIRIISLFISSQDGKAEYLPIAADIINAFLHTENDELFMAVVGLVSNLFDLDQFPSDVLVTSLGYILNKVKSYLIDESPYADNVLNNVESIVESLYQFQNPIELIKWVISLVEDNSVPLASKPRILDVIITLIQRYPDESLPILNQLLIYGVRIAVGTLDEGGSIDEQDSLKFVTNLIQAISSIANRSSLVDFVLKLIDATSDEALIVSVVLLYELNKEAPETVAQTLIPVIDFALKCITYENACVQEGGYRLVGGLSNRPLSPLFDSLDEILQASLHSVSTGCTPVITAVLKATEDILMYADFSSEQVSKWFQFLGSCLQNLPVIHSAQTIKCLARLVCVAGDNVTEYSKILVPILEQSSAVKQPELSGIKAASIEAISTIMKHDKTLQGMIQQYFPLFVQCATSDDLSLVGSGFAALSNIAPLIGPEFMGFVHESMEVILKVLDPTIAMEDDETEVGDQNNRDLFKAWGDSIRFIKVLARYFGDEINEYKDVLKERLLGFIERHPDEQYKNAMSTLTELSFKFPDILETLVNQAIEDVEEPLGDYVLESFHCIAKVLEHDIPINDEQLKQLIDIACLGVKRKLPCQETLPMDTYEEESCYAIYRFLKASTIYDKFPIHFFLKIYRKFAKKNNFEASEIVGIIGTFYMYHHDSVGDAEREKIRKIIYDSLDLVDFYISPEPIIAMQAIVEYDYPAFAPIQQRVIDRLMGFIQKDFDGELSFSETKAAASSALLYILRFGEEVPEVQEILSSAISVLPPPQSSPVAPEIFQNIAYIWERYHDVCDLMREPFFSLTANVLSLPEEVWDSYLLAPGVVVSIVIIFQTLCIAKFGKDPMDLSQYDLTDQAIERICDRVEMVNALNSQ